MSDKLRCRFSLVAVLLAVQTLTSAADAQQPEGPRPPDRATPADTPQPMPPQTTDRTMPPPGGASSKAVEPQTFVKQAAVIGQAEVELGRLALQKSQDENVRKFAQRMVTDHTAAAAKLKKIASAERIEVPQSLDAQHQAVVQKLSGLQGSAFDKEYAKEMAKGHDKAVVLFESASQAPQMPADLKEFAAATLPTLEQHREMAHSIHEQEGGA
jgi:putative membrane protein